MSKKILVTGGGGFIGTHVVHALRQAGHTVRVFDTFYVSPPAPALQKAQLWMGDVKDAKLMKQVLEGVDACVHLATVPSIERARGAADMDATVPLFEVLAKANIPTVFASSSSIYGNNEHTPLKESEPNAPLSQYAVDKTVCEMQAKAMKQKYPAWQVVGLRMFNVYGEGQSIQSPYCGLITIVCHRLRHHQPIQIYGQGEHVRDFVHVEDVAHAFERTLDKMLHQQTLPQLVYNVCSGHGVTLKEVIDSIERKSGRVMKREYLPPKPSDIMVSVGDPSAAQADLGFKAEKPLDKGISQAIDYYFGGVAGHR